MESLLMVAMVTFRVNGLSTAGSSGLLQSALSSVTGVTSAQVTKDPQQAMVQYNEDKVTLVTLHNVVEDAGFDVLA